jgi:hypothetical protein
MRRSSAPSIASRESPEFADRGLTSTSAASPFGSGGIPGLGAVCFFILRAFLGPSSILNSELLYAEMGYRGDPGLWRERTDTMPSNPPAAPETYRHHTINNCAPPVPNPAASLASLLDDWFNTVTPDINCAAGAAGRMTERCDVLRRRP